MSLMYEVNALNAAMVKAAVTCRSDVPERDKVKAVLACFAAMKPVDAVPVEDYDALHRRLRHLLESAYIASFDEVNPVSKKYIRDIAEADCCLYGARDTEQAPPLRLTIPEMRKMHGEPVWVQETESWAIVVVEQFGAFKDVPFVRGYLFD